MYVTDMYSQKSKEHIGLIRFSIGISCIFCLCFNIVTRAEETIPCHVPVLLIGKLLTSHRCIISSFTFKSKVFHCIAIFMVF